MGLITGAHSPVLVTGRRSAIAGTRCLAWPGSAATPTLATEAIAVEWVSSSASDAAAGTGARTVKLYYLTMLGAEATATTTLNGTTAVAGPVDFYRAQRAVVLTVGSGGVPAGNLTLRKTDDTGEYEYVAAGDLESQSCRRTVPTGSYFELAAVQWSVIATTAKEIGDLRIEATVNPESGELTAGIFHPLLIVRGEAITETFVPPPIKFPAACDIRATSIRLVGAGDIGVSVSIVFRVVT